MCGCVVKLKLCTAFFCQIIFVLFTKKIKKFLQYTKKDSARNNRGWKVKSETEPLFGAQLLLNAYMLTFVFVINKLLLLLFLQKDD